MGTLAGRVPKNAYTRKDEQMRKNVRRFLVGIVSVLVDILREKKKMIQKILKRTEEIEMVAMAVMVMVMVLAGMAVAMVDPTVEE